jgi:hypothetical protein
MSNVCEIPCSPLYLPSRIIAVFSAFNLVYLVANVKWTSRAQVNLATMPADLGPSQFVQICMCVYTLNVFNFRKTVFISKILSYQVV